MDTPLLKRAYNLGLKAVPNFTALSEEQICYFEAHLDELQTAISRGFIVPEVVEPTGKFNLLVDLGIITVPDDYVHESRLASFGKKNRKKFYYYNDNITDKNFPNPTRVLKPGDKLCIRGFKQIVGGSTTSEERIAFLARQKAVYTGAQGASLVWEQKRDQLPRGYWYSSFDEKERRWEDADANHEVPGVLACSDGGFFFSLGDFESVRYGSSAFLCFCDLPDEAKA